jgi:hypothetical protein
MMNTLDQKHFSAFPAGNNADLISQKYRELLLLNMVGYMKSIQNSLDVDISFIISKYEDINSEQKFSPTIYNLFSKLSYCASKGEVPQIIDVLHELNVLKNEDILDSKFQFSTILTEKWELDFISKIRNEHIPSKSGENTLILPILNPNLSIYEKLFLNLKEQIKQIDVEFYQELESYVTRVKLFNGKALKAATSASIFGAIYLKLPPVNESPQAYFADHIIHETSHLHLDILLAFDKIVLNENKEKFDAPIRIDPRPMTGIFHATFVLSRMVRLFQRLVKDTQEIEYIKRLDIFKRQFDNGFETIEKNAKLTENGYRIKNSFIKTSEM